MSLSETLRILYTKKLWHETFKHGSERGVVSKTRQVVCYALLVVATADQKQSLGRKQPDKSTQEWGQWKNDMTSICNAIENATVDKLTLLYGEIPSDTPDPDTNTTTTSTTISSNTK